MSPKSKSPKIRNKSRRQSEALAESLAEDLDGFNLSPETRELLVKFKTSKNRDPFHPDNDAIIDKLVSSTRAMEDDRRNGINTPVNLKEAALLLECSALVYTSRVDALRRDVKAMAQRILESNYGPRKTAQNEEDSNKHLEETAGDTLSENVVQQESEVPQTKEIPEKDSKSEEEEVPSIDSGEEIISSVLEENLLPSEEDKNNNNPVFEVITIDDDIFEGDDDCQVPLANVTMVKNMSTDETQEEVAQVSQFNDTLLESTESETPVSKVNADDTCGDNELLPRKRSKLDYGLPPLLTPYYEDEYSYGQNDSSHPPLLLPEKLLKRKIPQQIPSQLKKSNEKINSVLQQSKLAEGLSGNTDTEEVLLTPKRRFSSGSNPNESTSTTVNSHSLDNAKVGLPEGVVIKVEKPDTYSIVPLGTNSTDHTGFGTFTPADEAEIQNFINKLHYLPFTCELSNEEAEKTFKSTVERLENIYKEHNVQIYRHVATATSQACAHISSSYAKWLETDKNNVPDPTVVHELFYQRIREEQAKHSNNTGTDLTIMERTQEKSHLESDVKLKEMLLEIRKHIVPRYTKIPLIEENTEGFFRRVRTFENKMKKILADDETRRKFDIREYEMDILDVTEKEGMNYNDEGEDTSQGLALNSVISSQIEPFSPVQFPCDGLPSPSSSDSSSKNGNGIKWISLTKIFSHMKTRSHHEVARMFYAVLALLSFQNLDINYDNYYSVESASLVAKNMNHDPDTDTKYPRGVKIMSSRCPNADTEEVYIAISTTKSRAEIYKELEQHQQEFEAQQEPKFNENIQEEEEAVVTPDPIQNPLQNHFLEFCKELTVNITQNPGLPNNLPKINGLLVAANSIAQKNMTRSITSTKTTTLGTPQPKKSNHHSKATNSKRCKTFES